MELPCDPAIPLVGGHPRETKAYIHMKACRHMLIALFMFYFPTNPISWLQGYKQQKYSVSDKRESLNRIACNAGNQGKIIHDLCFHTCYVFLPMACYSGPSEHTCLWRLYGCNTRKQRSQHLCPRTREWTFQRGLGEVLDWPGKRSQHPWQNWVVWEPWTWDLWESADKRFGTV